MKLRTLFDRAGAESDLDDELRFHLDQQSRLHVSQGMTPDEADRRARLALGGVELTKESYRDARGTRGVEELVGDVRHALRSLRRDRALAAAGMLTLALGIGATTAVFSAVNAVLLRDLPFADPGRLVSVWEENSDRGWYQNWVAPANYYDWQAQVAAFDDIAGYLDSPSEVTLIGGGKPQLLDAAIVAGNLFPVLGVAPALGRGFEPADDWDRGQQPAILSHRLWQAQFGGDPDIIGKSMSLGAEQPWQIVGVMPEGFTFPLRSTDIWLPFLLDPSMREQVSFRRAHWMRTVARLKPGVSFDDANAALRVVAKRLESDYPETNTRMGAGITPLQDWVIGDTRRPLIVLLAAAAVLLLIACANVGNLLLVHALRRSRDVALRLALGATRAHVARQALTEGMVLSLLGGTAGFAVGWVGTRALIAMQPEGMLPVTEIALDYRVLLFTIAVTAASGILFGTAPATIATRQAPASALQAGGRTFSTGSSRRWTRYLVVAEVALAVLLTVGAGLLVRSYDRLSSVAPGFDPEGVLTAELVVPGARYDSMAKVVGFYTALVERVRAMPGVQEAAAVRQLPATSQSWSSNLAVEGRPPMAQSQDVLHREILGDYFRVMRVPLLNGRAFSAGDVASAPNVVVVNAAMVKQYFPAEDPIGRRIAFDRVPDSTSVWHTIVGVVGDEHQGSLATPPRPEIFAPFRQDWTRGMTIVVRALDGRDPITLAQPVREAVRGLDSLLAITSIRPMTDVHREATSRQRFTSVLVIVFAASGVLLALVGVFGVLAQMVQSRWREMGIRLALGAQRSEVRWLIAQNGFWLLASGIAIGLLVSLGATRVLATLLYDVAPNDAITYAAVALLIGVAGMLAAWVPAWRASGADPAGALRAE